MPSTYTLPPEGSSTALKVFAAAVVAEDDGEAPALDGERHAVKRKRRLLVFLARGIGIGQIFSLQHG